MVEPHEPILLNRIIPLCLPNDHYKDNSGGAREYKLMQYTGLKDKNGVEIYEGDILNICFTSGSGEHIHDCVYSVGVSALGSIEFNFVRLYWENYGHNQFPINSTLCEKYGGLSTVYDGGIRLITPDKDYNKVEEHQDFPFNNNKMMPFNSRYFEVIGNIHENPELLEQ